MPGRSDCCGSSRTPMSSSLPRPVLAVPGWRPGSTRTVERRIAGRTSTAHGDWDALGEQTPTVRRDVPRQVFGAEVRAALRLAGREPAALADERHGDLAVALASADGSALTEFAAIADGLRADTVGDEVTYVVNRNINFTNVCYTGCRFCAFAQRESDRDAFTLGLTEIGERVDEAIAAGATEICMQGGIHPKLPGDAYFDIAAEVKRRPVHLHAFSPMEVVNGASKADMSIADWLRAARAAGVETDSRHCCGDPR